ncbi:Uncharacterised protein [Mycobacteroides abscessus subsp. abscessus]|nr:Uncharacterised protein [Mycobacteroides abscessus subsp. abscessus]
MPGSVMAMAEISSPEQKPGNQRAFCSSLARSRKYGPATSLCRLNPTPVWRPLVTSSVMIVL